MNTITKLISALFAGILFPLLARSQDITGIVKDSSGAVVPFASINLKSRPVGTIVAYTTTNTKGSYTLHLPVTLNREGLYLEVSCIGFKNQSRSIERMDGPVDFLLAISVSQLQSVTIRNKQPVLHANGDTLNYKVSDFSSVQDRVIGDVIKKLPGIAVAADGKISYNNKPISGVYIGGDNLLDDKYNIATGTIPHGVVDQVQVIENHQPIKVLQNKVVSDDVALNLSIKKNAKVHLLGQESIGAGVPGNYDVDLNAIMLKDKYKAINYLKGNNTGYDVHQDLLSHNFADYIKRIDNAVPATLLSFGSVYQPALSQNRYLFDQSGILNLNNLVNLQKGVQLKVNAYALRDRQRQDYQQQTTIYLPGDTVKYNEIQHNKSDPALLHGQFTLNINQDKYYLNDVLLLDARNDRNYSVLNTDSALLNQGFKKNALNFSNEFDLIKSLKNGNILETFAYVSHSTGPESRGIAPGYNAAIFNNGIPYAQLVQNVNVPSWYTTDYLSFKIPSNFITQSFKTGFSVQSQKLVSGLDVVQQDNSTKLESDSAVNQLGWTRKKVYAEADYDLPGNIIKANLSLPVTLQQIDYSDRLYALNKSNTRVYFNPQLKVKFQTGIEHYLTLLYSYRNETGSIEDIYQGYILKDYRSLFANTSELTARTNELAALGFNYRKTLTLFFFSINGLYNHIRANSISSNSITNSIQRGIVLPYANDNDSWTINGSISKYSFLMRTTFSGNIQWQNVHSVQIQNNVLLPFNTSSAVFIASADTKVSNWVNFSYKASFTQTESHSPAEVSAYDIHQLSQQASVMYNPLPALQCKLSGEHYFTRQQGNPDLSYFFADASAKYKVSKWKTQFELSAVNFLNLKTYHSLYLSANSLVASAYTLPGRIILLKALFNL